MQIGSSGRGCQSSPKLEAGAKLAFCPCQVPPPCPVNDRPTGIPGAVCRRTQNAESERPCVGASAVARGPHRAIMCSRRDRRLMDALAGVATPGTNPRRHAPLPFCTVKMGHLDDNAGVERCRRTQLPPSRSGGRRLDVRHLRKAFQGTQFSRMFTRLERPYWGSVAVAPACRS